MSSVVPYQGIVKLRVFGTVQDRMTDSFRFIGLESQDAGMNMAIDEAIMNSRRNNKVKDTFRLYRWKPSAVSIGFFQSIADEVNLQACTNYGVEVVRRITGGGAVYHDFDGEITYSLIAGVDNPKIPTDILKSYEVLCEGLVLGLKNLGLSARFHPVNDILVDGKKISGNAQTRKNGIILQHGTLLIDVNVNKMFELLKVTDEKLRDKAIKGVKERVTSVNLEIGKLSMEKVALSIREGFSTSLGVQFEEGHLEDDEVRFAKKVREEKYLSKEWTFQR